jgi:SAM-dependent methyltransferase
LLLTDPPSAGLTSLPEAMDPGWEGPRLARYLVRGHVRRGLDVGCGAGCLALVMSTFCERVVACDVNPRAVSTTKFNVALNGIGNVEVFESDLLDQLRPERYDRISFNTPIGWQEPYVGSDVTNSLLHGLKEQLLERFFHSVGAFAGPDVVMQLNLAVVDHDGASFPDRLRAYLAIGLPDGGPHQILYLLTGEASVASGRWRSGWLTIRRGPESYRELGRQTLTDAFPRAPLDGAFWEGLDDVLPRQTLSDVMLKLLDAR